MYSCSFTRLGHHLRIINESSQHWKITLRPWKAHFPGHPPGPGSLYMENSYSWYIAFSIVCVREFESWPKRWYKLVYFKFSIWGNWLCFFFLLINIYLLNMSIITSIWDILWYLKTNSDVISHWFRCGSRHYLASFKCWVHHFMAVERQASLNVIVFKRTEYPGLRNSHEKFEVLRERWDTYVIHTELVMFPLFLAMQYVFPVSEVWGSFYWSTSKTEAVCA